MDTRDTPEIPDTPEIRETPELARDRSADSRIEARRQRRNPNRRARRTASRLALATAMTVGAVGIGAGAASAESGDSGGHSAAKEIGAWEPSASPTARVPTYNVPTAKDYLGNVHIQDALPEGYEFPDDDADPELAEAEEEPAGDDRHDRVVEGIRPVDPDDEERVKPEVPEEEIADCEDPDFAAKYPEKCPDDEVPEEEPGEDPCEPASDTLTYVPEEIEFPEECDDPGETTTSTVPPETTTTITEYPEPEVEEATSERKAESLAFTGSGLALPLVGAGVLGAGAIIAGASVASRRRADAQGEA